MRRLKILYFIVRYPNFSETYMHEEIRSLREQYDIKIITYAKPSEEPRLRPFPYEVIEYPETCFVYGSFDKIDRTFSSPPQQAFLSSVGAVIEEFQPDVLHGHYFGMGLLLNKLADLYKIPFTIRTHSMDLLSEPVQKLEALCMAANSFWCLGILAFPSFRSQLLECGLHADKLVTCWPVINFSRFHKPERRPPTGRVLCAGPAIRKKAHNDFIDLAASMRSTGLQFDLYARGPYLPTTRERNERAGNVVNITYADPDDMPNVFPGYDWLVYPSDTRINKVGFPAAISEAQAGGLGVCWQELPDRRQSQLDFLAGGGFLFRSLDELPEILSSPYPEAMRLKGLEAAKRCDIEQHKHLLTEMWERVPSRRIETVHDQSSAVSIIIPYYEQPEWLARTVQSALEQTYANVEVIVVDDCSPNNPASGILGSAQLERVKLIRHQRNAGVSAARNTGIRASGGEFIVPLDSDDLLDADFVRECVTAANAGPYDCVYTYVQWFGDVNAVLTPDINLTNLLCRIGNFTTFLYRRKVFEAVGGYREDVTLSADTQFLLNVVAGGWRLGRVDKPLYLYRKHKNGMSLLEPYKRIRILLRNNRVLYQENWEKVIPKLEDKYVHILHEYYSVLREHNTVLGEHHRVLREHGHVLSEYRRILEAYERAQNEIAVKTQQIDDLEGVCKTLSRLLRVVGTMSQPERKRTRTLLHPIEKVLTKSIKRAKAVRLPEHVSRRLESACDTIASSGVFDEHYYRQQCCDNGLQVSDGISHFVQQGWKLGLSPNPFFDTRYYQSRLQEIGDNSDENPLLHYLQKGAFMGLPASPWFDTAWYLERYADVRESGSNPLVHFLHFGIREGRETIGRHAILASSDSGGAGTTPDGISSRAGISDSDLPFLSTCGTKPSSPYHLVIGIHEASLTGAPMLGMALAKGCKSRGLNPLIVLQGPGELKQDMAEIADVLDLSGQLDKPAILNRRLEQLSAGHHVLPVDLLYSAERRPLVILNSAELSPLHPVFKARGFEVVSLIHEFLSRYPLHYRECIWKNSDRLVFPTEFVKNDSIVENTERLPAHTLMQGLIDPDFGRSPRHAARNVVESEIGCGASDFVVVSCGTAELRKGIDLFVQTARQVVSQTDDVHFVWIGGEPGYGTNALEWAMTDVKQAGLSGKVHFLGHRREIEPYFVGADLFLLPSRQDPAPCVVHMAQSCALPVVAFAGAGGADEILAHGGGRLAPYLDVPAMSGLVLDYCRNREKVWNDGERGRQAVLEHYNFERYVDRLLELIGVGLSHNIMDVTLPESSLVVSQ